MPRSSFVRTNTTATRKYTALYSILSGLTESYTVWRKAPSAFGITMSYLSVVPSATNSLSVLVCLMAAIFVCRLQLYRQTVYRLALYHVLASLAVALIMVIQNIFIINYHKDSDVYRPVCIAVAWFALYSEWVKLLFTMWVTFHLFCFGVCHNNLKKLKVVYVVTSLLVPAVIAVVPLSTHTYGLTSSGTCWITDNNNTNLSSIMTTERFVLWYGSSIVMLLAASTAMVVMVAKLIHSICQRLRYGPIPNGDPFIQALKQLLPLAAFPIFFLVFSIPPFVYQIYLVINPSAENEVFTSVTLVSFSLWGLSSGVTLIVHICATRFYYSYKKTYKYGTIQPDWIKTVGTESKATTHSATSFPLPENSLSWS